MTGRQKSSKTPTNGGGNHAAVDPDQEIVNEPHGFQIRVQAKHFTDKDFKISIDAARVLALDGEQVVDNGNGTMTIKKLNRRWRLADDVDLRTVRAFLAADGCVEIVGEKLPESAVASHLPENGIPEAEAAFTSGESPEFADEEEGEQPQQRTHKIFIEEEFEEEERQRHLEEVEVEMPRHVRNGDNISCIAMGTGGVGDGGVDEEERASSSSSVRFAPPVPPKQAMQQADGNGTGIRAKQNGTMASYH